MLCVIPVIWSKLLQYTPLIGDRFEQLFSIHLFERFRFFFVKQYNRLLSTQRSDKGYLEMKLTGSGQCIIHGK